MESYAIRPDGSRYVACNTRGPQDVQRDSRRHIHDAQSNTATICDTPLRDQVPRISLSFKQELVKGFRPLIISIVREEFALSNTLCSRNSGGFLDLTAEVIPSLKRPVLDGLINSDLLARAHSDQNVEISTPAAVPSV